MASATACHPVSNSGAQCPGSIIQQRKPAELGNTGSVNKQHFFDHNNREENLTNS